VESGIDDVACRLTGIGLIVRVPTRKAAIEGDRVRKGEAER
jgi:hypothetical protein